MENKKSSVIDDVDEVTQILNDNLTPLQQEALFRFIKNTEGELIELGDSGEVEINWDNRTISAFLTGEKEPIKTWNLDEVLELRPEELN